jgi:sugar lactone lactonase YvrE
MSSLRINFVQNNPPQGKIQNIRKEPFAQLPPNYVRPSTLGMNTNFKPIAPSILSIVSITQSGIIVNFSDGKHARSYRIAIYSSISSLMSSPTLILTQKSARSGELISFTPSNGLYYGVSVTSENHVSEESTDISTGISTALLYTAPTAPPTAPTVVTVTAISSTSATITWSGATLATSYTVNIYYNSSASVTTSNSQVAQSPYTSVTSGSTFSFTATDARYYAATVTAINSAGQATSTISAALGYFLAPGQPTTNAPTNTGTTLNMSWSAPVLGGVSITSYTVYVLANGSAAPSGTLSPGLVTSTTFSPMVSGTAYSFYVVANGNGGSGTQSTTSSTVTYTAAPGQTTVNTPTNTGTTLNMSWTAPASGGTVTGYTVYVLANGSAAPSGTLSPGLVTSTTFSPMVSGTAYSFYVVATGPGGSGTQSTTSSTVTYTAAPVAPTSVTFSSLTGTGTTVTWSGGSGATSYTCQIYSSSSSNMSSPSTVSQTPSASTSVTSPQAFTFTATNGLYYGAIVTAINTGGSTASSMSTGVLYTAAPVAPTSITVSSLTGTGATVTWSGGSGAASYTCQIYSSASSNMSSPSTVSQTPSASTSVTSPQAFTFTATNALYYGAIVTAVNAGGSTASSMSTGVLYTAPPVAPTTVTLSSLTVTGATVTWSGGSGAASYTCQIYSSSSSNMSSPSTVSQSPSASTSVTSSQAFTFTATDALYYGAIVTAVNAASSTASSMSTGVLYTLPPVAPTTVTLASLTGTGASVSWSGGSGATSYTVQIYSSASSDMSSPSTVSQTPLSSASVTSPQAFTFTATVSLYYGAIVTAVNSGGSTASSMSTGVLYASSPPVAPTSVTLASLTGSGATVTWSGGSGATSYTCQIYYSTASNMSSPATVSQSPSSSTSVSSGQSFSFSAEDSLYYGAIITAVNAGGSVASSMSTGVQFVGVYTGLGPVSTLATGFGNLYNLAIDSAENIYVADYGGHKIWYIPSGGSPSIFAGSTVGLVNGDAASAKFNGPSGVAISPDGSTVYVSDYGNSKIRMITGGIVSTLAGGTHGAWLDGSSTVARFYYPSGIAIDRTGTVLFIGDKLTHRIRVVTIATGAVTTLAGGASSTVGASGAFADGTGASASFNSPLGVCVGLDNSVYVADSTNQRIRKVTYPGGVVTTIAGDGTNAFLNGTGTGARFSGPYGVAMDSYGILYVADKDSKRIRQITRATVVTTFAGTGTNTSVDNANRSLATFVQPTGVVVNYSRTALYVTQTATPAVRKITLN